MDFSRLRNFKRDEPRVRHYWAGSALMLGSAACGAVYTYYLFYGVASQPKESRAAGDVSFTNALSELEYYTFLVPLLILPTFLAMYINWYSMQTFEHN